MKKKAKLRKGIFETFQMFFQQQAASGIILLLATIVALIWANCPVRESYDSLWHLSVVGMSLRHWTNDGLMAVFFFVVGLEIKREILSGELSTLQKASLPIAAALGGMIVPALIFAAFNWNNSSIRGWGIPMATDIAFAIGVLSLLGKRVPHSLKIFLTALAIADDIGAVLVIALFYTSQISWVYLLLGLVILSTLYAFNKFEMKKTVPYLIVGSLIWFMFLRSGVHATVAGVLLAMVIPSSVGTKLEHILHPWVSFGIMPIFALANAGVTLAGGSNTHPIVYGIIAGLVLGKQIGISLFSWLAVHFKFALLPNEMIWKQLYGVSWLGGIGFTMSLFIANLAFGESIELELAKVGILVASLISGVIGAWILTSFLKAGRNVARL